MFERERYRGKNQTDSSDSMRRRVVLSQEGQSRSLVRFGGPVGARHIEILRTEFPCRNVGCECEWEPH